jgi:hypothetical protein
VEAGTIPTPWPKNIGRESAAFFRYFFMLEESASDWRRYRRG